jgi:homoserine kinase
MSVLVEAPATSANLGPGFDCLGLALELRDRVRFDVADDFSARVSGEGAAELPTGSDHLVLVSFRKAFEVVGRAAPTVALTCENVIPQGRGLGSSSAAIVAGIAGARAMGADLTDEEAVAVASEIEGHPDNVAPAILGGMTVAWTDDCGKAVRMDPAITRVSVVVPAQRLATRVARTLLPNDVPYADAVHAVGRAALAVAALTRYPQHLLAATEDRLHQDYRKPAYPQSWDLVQDLRACSVPAAISGAGPSVIAFGPAVAPEGWRLLELNIASEGVRVL